MNKYRRSLRRRKARAALFAAQSGKCHYCKIWVAFDKGTVDHMHPTSKGGSDTISNMVFCCRRCNADKADTPYQDYLDRLAKKKQKKGTAMVSHNTITNEELAKLCGVVDQANPIKGLGLTFGEQLLERLLNRIQDDISTINRLTRTIEGLEQLRPHWAEGHTTDSGAAQAKTIALSQLWQLLRTDNQTEAVIRLKQLIELVKTK